MDWDGLKNETSRCFGASIVEMDDAKLEAEFITFWNRFAKEVIPKNVNNKWDYLFISVKGPDGYLEIWPQESGAPPKEVFWSAILLKKLWFNYGRFSDDDFGEKAIRLDTSIANLFITAAEAVHLNELVGKPKNVGLKLQFHDYDNTEPFLVATIGKN